MPAKITLEKLPPNWKEMMIQIGKEGGMHVHYANALGVARATLDVLERDYEDFALTLEEAKRYSEEWWIHKAMEAFEGGKSKMFNQHLWGFIMKNRFPMDWKDKTEMDITSNGKDVSSGPIQIEIIKSQDK